MKTLIVEPASWSTAQKVAFRFFFLLFLGYMFFNPFAIIPSDNVSIFYIKPFHTLIPWLAKHVLHMGKPVTVFTNGSGDTTYDYLTVLLMAVLAIIGTVVWSGTGRKTKHYNKLFYWLCVVLRFYVGMTIIGYGTFKVIKLQFPFPSLERLVEPLGNMSPMGLAWNYIGYSTAFNYLTGFAEITCGLLLFFRKTTTLGAILGVVVIGNVVIVNYCFDVPVKLLSTALVAMCLFLLARDSRRLVNFFFKNKEALPSNLSPHRFNARWKNITLTLVKCALILYVFINDAYSAAQASKQYGPDLKKPPLYGLYNVVSFVRNKDTLPPLTTDTFRWSKLIITRYAPYGQVNLMNDNPIYLDVTPDTAKHKIVFNDDADTLHKFAFTYSAEKPDLIVLNGKWKQDSLHIRLERFDENKFPLLKRGFHWVNEYPYNR